jgi:ketosteroid isomerase-like protein
MSSEALTVVRAFFDAVGDANLAEHLDPEVVWFGTRGGLDESRVMRGPQAVLDYLREIQDAWESFDVEVERLLESGDSVVVFMREKAHARQGGVELQDNTAMILTVRNGKIVEMRGYLDRDEALRAAGLER